MSTEIKRTEHCLRCEQQADYNVPVPLCAKHWNAWLHYEIELNEICKCGHTAEKHYTEKCKCIHFRQAYWTHEEINRAKQKAEEYMKRFGVEGK